MTRYALSSEDVIILRDGRPFGDTGVFGGTALDWPLPQTLAGMCRSSLGFGRSEKYFAEQSNIERILTVGIKRILPGINMGALQEFLLPTPADLVLTEKTTEKTDDEQAEGKRRIHPLSYKELADGEGTDLNAPLWLYPTLNPGIKDKPSPSPRFLRWDLAEAYLGGRLPADGKDIDLNTHTIVNPVRDFRIHSAIDPASRSVDEGRLYAESGIYLKCVSKKYGEMAESNTSLSDYGSPYQGDLMITFELEGAEPDEALPASMYLGGERRRVDVTAGPALPFPECPDFLENQTFLKLVLITHGDFETWVPDWLAPGGNTSPPWVTEPRSGVELRLRSAAVNGWDPASGWDYATKKQKTFRKLVRPGSVYVVELKNPAEAGVLAKSLWGQSICPANCRAEKDGYGQVLIAKTC